MKMAKLCHISDLFQHLFHSLVLFRVQFLIISNNKEDSTQIDIQGAGFSVPGNGMYKLEWPIPGTNGVTKLSSQTDISIKWTQENIENNGSLNLAKFLCFQKKTNYNSSVLMTYSDSLFFFGKWYLQLWAESIGKNNKGITAIHSIGTTDQHSQLQLYLQGPRDKFFTFVTTDHKNLSLIHI